MEKIPSPYKTGFYSEAIINKTPALISLVDPKGFIKSFVNSEKDHIQFLLETQKKMNFPIFIVPQLILFKQKTEKDHSGIIDMLFGYKDHVGLIRKIILFFRSYKTTFIDFGSPINLKTYVDKHSGSKSIEDISFEIRKTLIERIDSQKRIVLGPIMKSRQQLKEIVLKDKDINDLIEKTSGGDHLKIKQNRKKSGRIF